LTAKKAPIQMDKAEIAELNLKKRKLSPREIGNNARSAKKTPRKQSENRGATMR
jgi:hypothetical protein